MWQRNTSQPAGRAATASAAAAAAACAARDPVGAQPHLDLGRDTLHRARRVAYAIIDVVTRYWIGYLLTSEMTSTQVQLLFARALEDQGLLDLATGELLAPTDARSSATAIPLRRSWHGRITGRR